MSNIHFDVVVVGSGFGGSVMAYRLAEAGFRVCVLERGKSYPPGSFPRSPYRMKRNFWDPSAGLYGMFNIWSFPGISSIVSSGLGGGSLIYANVLLRKEEKWFLTEDLHQGGYQPWPITRADLDPHYDQVEKMMHVQQYPLDQFPYNTTAKTLALQQAARQLNLDWFRPNLAVTFGNEGHIPVPGEPIREDYPNLHGRTRSTCRLCGECDIGCNYGSKNTLDYTYLSAAKRLGAEIWSNSEVRSFRQREEGAGYHITYVQHHPAHEGEPLETHNPTVLPSQTLTTDILVLAAGTFGTNFLLLKNQAFFPHISKMLGTQFSGNGDLITLALRCSKHENGKKIPRVIDGSYGPVITSAVRVEYEEKNAVKGFYIQDAGYPEFLNWILQVFDAPSELEGVARVLTHLAGEWLHKNLETDLGKYISQIFGTCDLSSSFLPLLGMGLDTPGGRMTLRDGNVLNLDWTKTRSGPYFDRLRQQMISIADSLGATFVDDPLWYLGRLISAHPLGGCAMGRDITEGVVNIQGEVFSSPHLYIADGSIMPGPVGANPSLTIAAMSDRIADGIIERKGGSSLIPG